MKPIFVIFVCMLFIVGPYLSIDILAVSEPNQSENANQSDVQSDEIINKIDVESYTLNIGKKIRTIDNNIRFINIPNFSDLEITITLYNENSFLVNNISVNLNGLDGLKHNQNIDLDSFSRKSINIKLGHVLGGVYHVSMIVENSQNKESRINVSNNNAFDLYIESNDLNVPGLVSDKNIFGLKFYPNVSIQHVLTSFNSDNFKIIDKVTHDRNSSYDWYEISLINSSLSLNQIMNKYLVYPEIEWIDSFNGFGIGNFYPNDPWLSDNVNQRWQWNLGVPASSYNYGLSHALQAWDKTTGRDSVVVATLDTGIDSTTSPYEVPTHQDLSKFFWKGYCAPDAGGGLPTYCNGDPYQIRDLDVNHHGTEIAGIIGATINNNLGIAGIAQTGLMVVKVAPDSSFYDDDNVASGMHWAVTSGANIISMSFGFQNGVPYAASKTELDYAYSQGVLLIASAGNQNALINQWPASDEKVITVGAVHTDIAHLDPNKAERADWSSYGPTLDIMAPSSNALGRITVPVNDYPSTTRFNSYSLIFGGTSFSTPHVAGAAALIWAINPSLTNNNIRDILLSTAIDYGSSGWDEYYGYGVLDFQAAIQKAIRDTQAIQVGKLYESYTYPQYYPTITSDNAGNIYSFFLEKVNSNNDRIVFQKRDNSGLALTNTINLDTSGKKYDLFALYDIERVKIHLIYGSYKDNSQGELYYLRTDLNGIIDPTLPSPARITSDTYYDKSFRVILDLNDDSLHIIWSRSTTLTKLVNTYAVIPANYVSGGITRYSISCSGSVTEFPIIRQAEPSAYFIGWSEKVGSNPYKIYFNKINNQGICQLNSGLKILISDGAPSSTERYFNFLVDDATKIDFVWIRDSRTILYQRMNSDGTKYPSGSSAKILITGQSTETYTKIDLSMDINGIIIVWNVASTVIPYYSIQYTKVVNDGRHIISLTNVDSNNILTHRGLIIDGIPAGGPYFTNFQIISNGENFYLLSEKSNYIMIYSNSLLFKQSVITVSNLDANYRDAEKPRIEINSASQIQIMWLQNYYVSPGNLKKVLMQKRYDTDGTSTNPRVVQSYPNMDLYDFNFVIDSENNIQGVFSISSVGDVYYFRLDNDGNYLTNPVLLNEIATTSPVNLEITTDRNNVANIVWEQSNWGNAYDIFYSKVTKTGVIDVPAYAIAGGAGNQRDPSIVLDSWLLNDISSYTFWISYEDNNQVSGLYDVKVTRCKNNPPNQPICGNTWNAGLPYSSINPFLVIDKNIHIHTGSSDEFYPSANGYPTYQVHLVWCYRNTVSGSPKMIVYTRFEPDGKYTTTFAKSKSMTDFGTKTIYSDPTSTTAFENIRMAIDQRYQPTIVVAENPTSNNKLYFSELDACGDSLFTRIHIGEVTSATRVDPDITINGWPPSIHIVYSEFESGNGAWRIKYIREYNG